eukprot:jgi/Chlat1/4237/Chrsp27S00315
MRETQKVQELSVVRTLDVGAGNGALLLALFRRGFAKLTGTDYSKAGVELARCHIAGASSQSEPPTKLLVDDVLNTSLEEGAFDLITDKGTLDAIGLHPQEATVRRRQYRTAVHRLLAPSGLLVITSCNSTWQELRAEYEVEGDSGFQYMDHVRTYPTFKFGGHEGTRVSTIALRKR